MSYRIDDGLPAERHPLDPRRFRTLLPSGVMVSTVYLGADVYETLICRSVEDEPMRSTDLEMAELVHHLMVVRAGNMPFVSDHEIVMVLP